jgi:hypothetical protein
MKAGILIKLARMSKILRYLSFNIRRKSQGGNFEKSFEQQSQMIKSISELN